MPKFSGEQLRVVEGIRQRYVGVVVDADGMPRDETRAEIAGELAQVGLALRSIMVTRWGRFGAHLHIDVGVLANA